MEWLEKLIQFKKESGKTLEEIAKASGVPRGTLNKMFAGATKDPQLGTMRAVVHSLGHTLDDLADLSQESGREARITLSETAHINKYRALDAYGREAVDALMNIEHSRVMAQTATDEEATVRDMIVYTYPAAAGTPLFAEGDFERLEFKASQVPKGADFGIKIRGDSMMPTLADDEIVWVRKQSDIQNGQIGIFMLLDEAVCKRYYKDKDGVRLQSDNKKYEDIRVTDFETFYVVGKVLEHR